MELSKINKMAAYNGRFGAMAAVARRQFCTKLYVITPQQVQWKPPLRQAAETLSVSLTKDSKFIILKRKEK